EPDGWDDMAMSLARGEVVPVGPNPPPTLCDAIQTLHVAQLTLDILRQRQARAAAVSDAEVEAAIRFAWEAHRLVAEPGGAAALAAVLAGKIAPVEDTVIVVSGGNVDPALHARIIGGWAAPRALYSPGSTWTGLERSTARVSSSSSQARVFYSTIRTPRSPTDTCYDTSV